MLVLTNQTLTIDKFKEIIDNINQTFNNPIWLNQEKTYFKVETIHNLFCNYYFERVIKSNTFSYFLKQLELLLIEHLPTLYTKSISHLDGIFEKMLDSEFWRAKSKSYNLNKQNSLNQDGSMPSSQNLLSELDKAKIEEIYLASSRYDQRQSQGEFNRVVVNLVDEYILKNNINVNMGILQWLSNFESLFSNFIIAKDDNILNLIEDSDIEKILHIFNLFNTGKLKGEKGEKGEQGLKGEKGERGERGEQGVPGLQGIQGIRGEKGEKGDQGLPGNPGAKGEKGDPGEPGQRGERGEKGEPGTITDEDIVRILANHPQLKGEKGEKGDRGERGANGTNGTNFRSQDVNLWQVPLFNRLLNAIKANYEIKKSLVDQGLLQSDGTTTRSADEVLTEKINAAIQQNTTNNRAIVQGIIRENLNEINTKIRELETTTARIISQRTFNSDKYYTKDEITDLINDKINDELAEAIDQHVDEAQIKAKINEIIDFLFYIKGQSFKVSPPKVEKIR